MLSIEDEEERRFEKFRRDLQTWERWNMLPDWKRIWWGEKTREDLEKLDELIDFADDLDKMVAVMELAGKLPQIQKSIKLAESAETAGRFWRHGILAFVGGVIALGPGLKALGEVWVWMSSFFKKLGAP